MPRKGVNIVDPVTGLRRLFYLVTPNETSYAEIDDVPDIVSEAVPYFFILMVIESLIIGVKKVRLNDAASSITAGAFSELTKFFIISFEIGAYIWVYKNFCIYELPWNHTGTWILAMLGMDLGYYWFHRAAHEVNIMWAAHQVHHSSEEYNLSTALRQSVVQTWFSWVFYLPLALFIRPSVFLVHSNFNLIYQFWIHTSVVGKLGPLEWVLNTPSHHRVHHGRNRYAIDKNYAGFLIIWDRMFGTFMPESATLSYGLTHPLTTYDPWEVQLCHFKHIIRTCWNVPTWSEKLSVLLKGPGWQPGKPRLGLIEDIPDVKGPRKIVFDPQIGIPLTIYTFIHFLLTSTVYMMVLTFKTQMSAVLSTLMSIFVLFSLTLVGWLFEDRPIAKRLEMIRCVVVCVVSQLLAKFGMSTLLAMMPEPVDPQTVETVLNAIGVIHLISVLFLAYVERREREMTTDLSKNEKGHSMGREGKGIPASPASETKVDNGSYSSSEKVHWNKDD